VFYSTREKQFLLQDFIGQRKYFLTFLVTNTVVNATVICVVK